MACFPFFSFSRYKCIIKQTLAGLSFLHQNNVVHRDIKVGNLLVSKNGVMKIADLGLARVFDDRFNSGPYTKRVVTLWYRAPELLLGCTSYTPAIDMWSMGAIIVELMIENYQPAFSGDTEMKVITKIWDRLGSPNSDSMLRDTNRYKDLGPKKESKCNWQDLDNQYDKDALTKDFIKKAVCLEPDDRLTVSEAIRHPWFTADPPACPPNKLYLGLSAEDKSTLCMQSYVLKKYIFHLNLFCIY